MHNVEQNGEGKFKGWFSGDSSGCPSQIDLLVSGRKIWVQATKEREDVLYAGHTLFSGFDLRVSSDQHKVQCVAELEGRKYNITPAERASAALIRVDDVGKNYLSGWVNYPKGLFSLVFFDETGPAFCDLFVRSDVNAGLGTSSEIRHGFSVKGLDVSRLVAVNINNELIHWFPSSWLAGAYKE